MIDSILSATQGAIDLPWWGYVLVLLGTTHVTIAAVTIFLHRAQAHRALDLHPVVSHFFRLWLWLTTGMVTREWVAIHRVPDIRPCRLASRCRRGAGRRAPCS